MNELPPIGSRVVYTRKATGYLSPATCRGEVVAHYRGGDRHNDPETGEDYVTPDHVGIRVDKPLPAWWPYIGSDRFAPSIDEIEPELKPRTRAKTKSSLQPRDLNAVSPETKTNDQV